MWAAYVPARRANTIYTWLSGRPTKNSNRQRRTLETPALKVNQRNCVPSKHISVYTIANINSQSTLRRVASRPKNEFAPAPIVFAKWSLFRKRKPAAGVTRTKKTILAMVLSWPSGLFRSICSARRSMRSMNPSCGCVTCVTVPTQLHVCDNNDAWAAKICSCRYFSRPAVQAGSKSRTSIRNIYYMLFRIAEAFGNRKPCASACKSDATPRLGAILCANIDGGFFLLVDCKSHDSANTTHYLLGLIICGIIMFIITECWLDSLRLIYWY